MDALDRQARTAGWLYLLLVIPGPFVLIYLSSKLIVRGDAAATAANLLGHEKLFRFGMVADVAGSVFFLVLAFALSRLRSGVDRTQAAFVVALVMVSSAIACVNVLPNAAALALARASESLTVLDQTQREALAMLFLRLHSIGNTVNETFWGLWLVPFGMLVYRSGFPAALPRRVAGGERRGLRRPQRHRPDAARAKRQGVPLRAATALQRTCHHALAHHQGREAEAAGGDDLTRWRELWIEHDFMSNAKLKKS